MESKVASYGILLKNMEKLNTTEVNKKRKPNPLFKGMSAYLKDPKNFENTDKTLQAILKTSHQHKTASSYAKCALCQAKRLERQKQMKDLGFKSIQQYLEWKRIHTIIKEKKSFQLQ